TDAQTERPYSGLLVLLYYNGRSDRASLQRVSRLAVLRRTLRPSVPTAGYSSCCTTTDAQTERPYSGLVVLPYYDGRSDRASLQRVTRLAVLRRTLSDDDCRGV
ncbi:hypothetical protein, partial [uncultured Porphyromonas sp.]|uniref:hypothetical protein n=1 Tax=uncultured Porphyromonas sp. TaxID=159274 RepID=UPI002616AA7B